MNDKLLGLLGIARRSGNLKIGFEACDEAIKNGKAKLVLVASDTAARTEKELRFSAKEKPINLRCRRQSECRQGWLPPAMRAFQKEQQSL